MAFCLTPAFVQKFKQGLKDGSINPEKLAVLGSEQRRNFMADFVGKENAKEVNALFESKLLLKNQQRGMITWAKKTAGITPAVKRDLISRIEGMETVLDPEGTFLQDLASARLRIDVSESEAKNINQLAQRSVELRKNANEKGEFKTETERINYGVARVALESYVNELKLQSRSISFREQPARKVLSVAKDIPAIAKSAVASLDNSFWGRQGIKTLLDLRTSNIWARNFLKSFRDIGRQLTAKGKWYTSGDDAAMDMIKADIYSRPNALNGKYKAGNYQLDVLSEEAFPSSIPERIPLLGRLFKASEVAYNGGALRMRADLADRLIKVAESQGVNTLNKAEAEGMGHLIGSLTGRGSLEMTAKQQRQINVILFSIKFMKSNIDTLTAHTFDPKATKFTRTEARKNLLSMVSTLAVVHTIAGLLDPDSIEPDPRSTNFGKIKIFGHWVDTTGGMASFIRLASYVTPSVHNGKWSLWKKSSTGNWTDLRSGSFGTTDAFDTLIDGLFSNKLSPIAGMLRDGLRGEMFGGEKFTLGRAVENLITPLSIQNFKQLQEDPNSSFILGSVLLEALGLSTSTYNFKTDWSKDPGVVLQQFKDKVGEDNFNAANEDFNRAYNNWFDIVSQRDEYKALSDEAKSQLKTNAKKDIKDKIFEEYGFKYEQPKKTEGQEVEKKILDELSPDKISYGKKDSPLTPFVANVNKVLDLFSTEVQAGERRTTSIEIDGDQITYNMIDMEGRPSKITKNVDSDLSIGQSIGKLLDNLGRKLKLPELTLSEKLGYGSKEARLQAIIDQKNKLLGIESKDPLVEQGFIKAGDGYYRKKENGKYTYIDKDKIPKNILAQIEAQEELESKTGQNGSEITPYDDQINEVFGDLADEARSVLRWVDEDGNVHGENGGYIASNIDVSNEGYQPGRSEQLAPGDVMGADGRWYSVDRGLFRINSRAFATKIFDGTSRTEFDRLKGRMKAAGIDTSSAQAAWDDMEDSLMNIKMAKIIYDEGGWARWYAAPPDLRAGK